MCGGGGWVRSSSRVWHLWFVFIRLLFASLALPILFGLFIGWPDCTSWNEISGKRIGWGVRGRDRKGPVEREWKHRNFIHDFPRVPEVKHFGRCARPPVLLAWYLADKVAQSCVHYEIRGPEGYGEWKKWCGWRTRRPIVQFILPRGHSIAFTRSEIKFLPAIMTRVKLQTAIVKPDKCI